MIVNTCHYFYYIIAYYASRLPYKASNTLAEDWSPIRCWCWSIVDSSIHQFITNFVCDLFTVDSYKLTNSSYTYIYISPLSLWHCYICVMRDYYYCCSNILSKISINPDLLPIECDLEVLKSFYE